MLSSVARTNFMSCRLAPSTARPIGTPAPSVNTERLTPPLLRSVGFGPVFFPPKRRFGHRPIHTQPVPVDTLQLVEVFHAVLPQLQEDARFDPRRKAVMGGGLGTQLGLVQRRPLTAAAQHVEDGIGAATVGDTRAASAKAMAVDVLR